MRQPALDPICREGYGPGGAAVIVTCAAGSTLDDAAVRAAFREHGGRVGAEGSVAYLFRSVGVLRYARAPRLTERAVAAGAEDVIDAGEGIIEVFTDPVEREHVRRQLERHGHLPLAEEVAWMATSGVKLSPMDRVRLEALERSLSRIQGVTHVYTNAQTTKQLLAPV